MVEARKLATMDIDYSHRRDLRHEPILIIDPPNPFDRDDGVMVDYDFDRGLYRSLTVISDVAERVRPGTLAAQEAFERGNSHFFTHDRKVFPMLPTALVNACSLVQGKTRPVIYCETFWDMDGNEIDHTIGLGVIESQKTLAYGEMEDKIQGQGQSGPIFTGIFCAHFWPGDRPMIQASLINRTREIWTTFTPRHRNFWCIT